MSVFALDDVPAFVGGRVEANGSAAAGAAAFAVALLVRRLRDDRLDLAGTQMGADRPGGLGLVAQHRLGAGPRPSPPAGPRAAVPEEEAAWVSLLLGRG